MRSHFLRDATDCERAVHRMRTSPRGSTGRPRPTSLQLRPSRARVLAALDHGMPGSAMPAFPGFAPADRDAMVAFVPFRARVERPKHKMLEREATYDRRPPVGTPPHD